jgi:lambda family phage tail tape measure protein
MVKPSLDIGLNAPDIQAFKAKMSEASSHVGTVARQMTKQLLDMNTVIKDTLLASASRMAIGVVGKVALVVGSFKLMSDAIGAARDQLKDMVDLANRSQNLGVAPAFFQAWNAEARKLQVTTDDLSSALEHAFNATKEKSPIDIGAYETAGERITDVEKTLRVLNATVANGKLGGLVLFRDATTQEQKIQAVLKAMIQLEQQGHKLEALDLGERMFGTGFVDKIRQGRTSAESMLSTIQKASGDADGIFSDTLVRRAKEMDDQLKVAHQRLSTALKPSWDDLAGVLLTIKDYWSDTVNLIAKAVELSNQIKIPGFSSVSLDDKRKELEQVNAAINGTGGGLYGSIKLPSITIPGIGKVTNSTDENMRAYRDQLQREIAELAKGEQYGPTLPGASRGTGAAPTLRKTDSGDTDKLQSSIDGIQKRTAALNAEAAAVDQGTVARERSKIAAQLETVAMQANAATGKGSNVVTDEQRKHIDEVATAYANAAQAMQKAKIASDIKRGSQTALLDPEDAAIAERLKGLYPEVGQALNSVEAQAMRTNDAMKSIGNTMSSTLTTGLADILDGTKSVGQGFADMGRIIVRALEEAMIKMLIVQPIMRSLSGGFSDGGIVGAIGSALGIGGHYDTGGYTGPGGKYQPAGVVHKGEVVFSQDDVARHGGVAVVEAMRLRKIPSFADGGIVSPANDNRFAANDNRVSIAPQIAVTVTGSPGMTSAEHERMGETVGKAAMNHVKRMIGEELFRQRKQGGILSR